MEIIEEPEDKLIKRILSLIKRPYIRLLLVLLVIYVIAELYFMITLQFARAGAIALLYGAPVIVLLAIAMIRSTAPRRVVIWLRRFHNIEPYRFPLHTCLSEAGLSSFEVATIQDTRFKYSFLTGALKTIGSYVFLILLSALPALSFSLRLTAKTLGIVEPTAETVNSLPYLTTTVLYTFLFVSLFSVPIALALVRLRGGERLSINNWDSKINKWIDDVLRGRGFAKSGLKIFKCENSFWQNAVTCIIRRCDAAIVDISDLNENVRWELKQCAESLSGRQIILTYAVKLKEYPCDPSSEIYDDVIEILGDERANEASFIPYPEPMPHIYNRWFLSLSGGKNALHVFGLKNDVTIELDLALQEAFEKKGRKTKSRFAYCSFCGKEYSPDSCLVQGPSVTICKECVEVAADQLNVITHSDNYCVFCGTQRNNRDLFLSNGNYVVCAQCIEQCVIYLLGEGYKFRNLPGEDQPLEK